MEIENWQLGTGIMESGISHCEQKLQTKGK